jgi:hypothetical protein
MIPSANINGTIVEDGFEQIEELPRKNDIDPSLDGRREWDTEIDYNHLPGDSTIRDSTGEDPIDRMMKGLTRYQLMSFLHELLLFFISSFLFFPSHIKRLYFSLFIRLITSLPLYIHPSRKKPYFFLVCSRC